MRVVGIEKQDSQRRYVVIDEDGGLVEPIVRYLKYLDCVGSARQTLRSYAYSLKLYWEYLTEQQLDWQQVTLDDLSRFVLWLKLPFGSLKVLPAHPVPQARSNRTINHTLTVVRSFYNYHWRLEETVTNVKGTTTTHLPARARRYKSFLHHITKGSPVEKNILKQKEAKHLRPKTITKNQVQQLLDACGNERDRLFSQCYPQTTDLHELSTQDVDDFTSWIRADVQRRKLKNSNTYVNHHIQALAGWLSYLERTDHPIKPHLPLPRLIWPHHYPPLDHRSPSSTIKYIPQAVLEQLDRHLHQLTAVYIPVMIVLRASGWRISDVLALKWGTCLEQQNEKYCLVGDIQKTRILGHRIPLVRKVPL